MVVQYCLCCTVFLVQQDAALHWSHVSVDRIDAPMGFHTWARHIARACKCPDQASHAFFQIFCLLSRGCGMLMLSMCNARVFQSACF